MKQTHLTIAIAGASGDLGQRIVTAFTSELFKKRFKEIIVLSRKPYNAVGTTNRLYSPDDIASSLQDVDVVVNCIGSKGDTVPFKKALIEAIAATKTVQLYFPSEFGVDHYINGGNDAAFDFVEWQHKKNLFTSAKDTFKAVGRDDIKIVHVFPGLLMELSIGPWFGMDCTTGRFEAIGRRDRKSTYTSMSDVGNAVAALASMDPSIIPEHVRISGDCVDMKEIVVMMSNARDEPFSLSIVEAKEFRAQGLVVPENVGDPSRYLRVLIGNGKINFSKSGKGNHNELVNPAEGMWKWKTMQEYANETKGSPWSDV